MEMGLPVVTAVFGVFNPQFNVFLGIGLGRYGSSVYGTLSFYFAGMVMTTSLSQSGDNLGCKTP